MRQAHRRVFFSWFMFIPIVPHKAVSSIRAHWLLNHHTYQSSFILGLKSRKYPSGMRMISEHRPDPDFHLNTAWCGLTRPKWNQLRGFICFFVFFVFAEEINAQSSISALANTGQCQSKDWARINPQVMKTLTHCNWQTDGGYPGAVILTQRTSYTPRQHAASLCNTTASWSAKGQVLTLTKAKSLFTPFSIPSFSVFLPSLPGTCVSH